MAILLAAGLWAQEGEEDVGEVNFSCGLAFGGTGTNAMVGGAIGISIDRYLVLMVEGRYIPMGNGTLVPYPGLLVHSSGVYDFSIPLEIRVPLRHHWEPYGILAPVLIYNHYRRQGFYSDGTPYYFGGSDVRGGAETGGGVRYYLHKEWGLKGEFRYTITSRNFSTLSIGVFRQFQ